MGPQGETSLAVLGQVAAPREGRAELRRQRDPPFGVERVLVPAAEASHQTARPPSVPGSLATSRSPTSPPCMLLVPHQSSTTTPRAPQDPPRPVRAARARPRTPPSHDRYGTAGGGLRESDRDGPRTQVQEARR